MKRSNWRDRLAALIEKHKDCCNSHNLAELILAEEKEIGMLPPTNTCTLVPDPLRGGHKHSESKHEWDAE